MIRKVFHFPILLAFLLPLVNGLKAQDDMILFNRSLPSDDTVKVRVGFSVINITDIIEKNENIVFDAIINMVWKDERQAYEFEKKLQEGLVKKVGVNEYTEGVDMEVELHEYNEEWAQLQIERLKELRIGRRRDQNRGAAATGQRVRLNFAVESEQEQGADHLFFVHLDLP